MKRPHLLLIIILLFGRTPVAGAELEYTLSPLGYVVAPPTKPLYRILREWSKGGRVYNATYREPVEPEGGVPVDCDSTHAIGVGFIMRKHGTQRLRKKKEFIAHVWTHSTLSIRHRLLDHRHVKTFDRAATATYDWEMLDIDKKFKATGIWTLRSYIQDKLVFEGSFNLIGCDSDLRADSVPEAPEDEVESAGEPEEPLEVVCRKEKVTGSHRLTTVCRTRPQIERRRENDQDLARDIQTVPGDNRP